jgi:hypothetical protein
MTNMTPSPELVERLRRKLGKPNNLAILCDEAADEIERLRATHLEEVVRALLDDFEFVVTHNIDGRRPEFFEKLRAYRAAFEVRQSEGA